MQVMQITEAQQAKIYKNYKNTRLKLLKMNAAIWFNKICKTKQMTPKYCSIKINGNNRQNRKIQNSSKQIQNTPRNQIFVLYRTESKLTTVRLAQSLCETA
jgi:hypothetical protein